MLHVSAGAAVEMVVGITCKGFPGYCSESFPGQTCVVVCSKGRPNVPLCQVSSILNTHYYVVVQYSRLNVILKIKVNIPRKIFFEGCRQLCRKMQ